MPFIYVCEIRLCSDARWLLSVDEETQAIWWRGIEGSLKRIAFPKENVKNENRQAVSKKLLDLQNGQVRV